MQVTQKLQWNINILKGVISNDPSDLASKMFNDTKHRATAELLVLQYIGLPSCRCLVYMICTLCINSQREWTLSSVSRSQYSSMWNVSKIVQEDTAIGQLSNSRAVWSYVWPVEWCYF